ncbi:carotenoid 1,2-hydratase [Aggregicoccus sp. 17bor-14]|uniref:lipocalin-like domain-containing protein n=1 Tax=Myxococcaceae TaxID=31 RepID=UPI00129D21F5|nr:MULTISPECIES: lipocalin-like domain-containing protein [Myxococcaceae]MBF5041694.1 carotenoid 1,2-hydratase [Simulacricoccus sp. 17bor-14]MRI87476.1 carotenoid 1,2-hydratase [Aggregicoccus sp. 17bor-14]
MQRRHPGRGLVVGVALALLLLAVGAWWVTRSDSVSSAPAPTLKVAEALGGTSDEGYARALGPREFHFPEDHGPHAGFRTEWWYWTGNLETQDGRAFGYQLTMFRSALAPRAPERESQWGARQVYMAHFTLTDVAGKRFHAFEKFAREAQGLAGAEGAPFRVWVEDWEARSTGPGFSPVVLSARAGDVALRLTLEEGKAPVLQGERGLSQKGPEAGNASYYYSLTRMPSRGEVRVGEQRFAVTGESWMDREWSTSALSGGQVGWDWFALQLSDGSELMYYQLRSKDGRADPLSAGSLVSPGGEVTRLGRESLQLEVQDTWESPRGGSRYPAKWRVSVPSAGLQLTVTPRLADQELPVSVRYWEGAVRVEGTREGKPVQGRGYAELTGYAEAPRDVR